MSENFIKKTRYGWVDLTNIPVGKRGYFDWNEAIGIPIPFQYQDIISTITIVERKDSQYFYIDIPNYATHRPIYIGQIKNGQLGDCLGKVTGKFKFKVGDIVNDVEILAMRTQDDSGHRHKYLTCKCIFDGYEWDIREDHLNSGHRCPICKNSIGERQVKDYLISHAIKFLPQHCFDDCRNIRQLQFDFYLPELNVCIEYDGQQHFEPVDFAGKGEEWARQVFENTKLRDGIKNEYCKTHNIDLCRIKYTQNVKSALDVFFQALDKTQ